MPVKPDKAIQNVSFRDIDDFLDYLPDEELRIVRHLRELVFSLVPGVKEKLSYNVPYYKKYRNICFIWPSSVLWGSKKTYEGVRFGFVNGYLLRDDISFLNKAGRKQVYWRDFTEIKNQDTEVLKSFIYDAVILDEKLNRK